MTDSFIQANRRILIVDDNRAIHADFRKILCPPAGNAGLEAAEAELFGAPANGLSPAGFQVESAFQGQEGVAMMEQALLARQPYSVVFMDVRMPPGWDGIETTANLWSIAPDTQIVLCTAYSDYSWDEMVTRLGISDRLVILKKPFDNLEVIQLAHALTEKWRLRQEAQLRLEQVEAMVAARTQELRSANERLKAEMSERERSEEALRQSQKMQALGQLAGGIAHDFNNLLMVMRGNVDSLLVDENHSPETRAALQEISGAAQRATNLTSQILTFSRKKRMHPQELDLNEVIRQLSGMLQRLAGETITVHIKCSSPRLLVEADPTMTEQILLNLAANARDAMAKGGQLMIEAAEIEIASDGAPKSAEARPGKFACVSVTDTGTGIPPEAMPHIFEPFFTTKEPGKGTGLGLATVYSIVQQHRGWIEIENRAGEGATFKVFLPAKSSKVT
jgi:signal transduction histidine kinase